MQEKLIRLLGGDPRDTLLLMKTLKREREARRMEHTSDGLDLQSLQVIIAIPLALTGLGTLVATVMLRHDTALAATLIFSVYSAIFVSMVLIDLINGLLGDEELRVIATWPISSSSILLARLSVPFANALKLAAFVAAPACIAACFCLGTPLVTGVSLLLLLFALVLALTLITSAGTCFLLAWLGLERLRFAVVALVIFGFAGMALLLSQGEPSLNQDQWSFTMVPAYLPTAWLGALASLTTDQPQQPLLALVGLLGLGLLPYLSFVKTGAYYSRGLLQRQPTATRARAGFLVKLLSLNSHNPADQVLAKIIVAHGRNDWRFQAQALLGLALSIYLLVSSSLGTGKMVFSDPFIHEGYLHPAMMLMVAIMVPPIFMVSLLSCSSEYKAAWILKMGQITPLAFRLASRRMQRVIYVGPVVFSLCLVYLINGVAPLHVFAHVLMLFLLTESMIGVVQSCFGDYPMSLPSQDEALSLKLIPLLLLLEILGGLYSAFIYNVLYRWWWSYILGIAVLVLLRRALLKFSLTANSLAAVVQEPEQAKAEKTARTTPLILATREGRTATVRLLLQNPNCDLNALDESGQTALDWAKSLNNLKLVELLEKHGG